MKSTKVISRIIDVLILSVISMYLISAGFRDSRTSGWYQQWFPNLNGSTIKDITFLDSLTGFAVTTTNSSLQAYILKTTNGGDNWNIVHTYISPSANSGFTRIQFADSLTGYTSTNYFDLLKTTNSGINWTVYQTPWGGDDMAVINGDTVLLANYDPIMGGVYRSTNGGINWTRIWTNGTNGNPTKIYMYDKNLGFLQSDSYYMRRTTNGGFNWIEIPEIFSGIEFKDSLIGWKTYGGIQKTTNGGLNWLSQQLPNISSSYINSNLDIVSTDTVWMVGAEKFGKPPVYKTTNGGLNWGYQIPDTNLQVYAYDLIQFVNSEYGWTHPGYTDKVYHTTSGGSDTTIYTGIGGNEAEEITEYELFQNYPNPFNSITNIEFKVQSSKFVNLVIYDILGKEVKTLVNEKKQPGTYQVRFDAEGLPSGVYFYSMIIDGKNISTKKLVLLK